MNNTLPASLADNSVDDKAAASQSFFKFNAAMARKLRQASLTASEWKLWSYLITLDPFGDRYVQMPDVVTIMSECEMSKASVYRAMAKFQELDLFDFQTNTKFRNLNSEKSVSNLRQDSQSCETKIKTEKSISPVRKSKPETQSQQDFEIPQTIQTFSDSSESEEEELLPPALAPFGGASPATVLNEEETPRGAEVPQAKLTNDELKTHLAAAVKGVMPSDDVISQLRDSDYWVCFRRAAEVHNWDLGQLSQSEIPAHLKEQMRSLKEKFKRRKF